MTVFTYRAADRRGQTIDGVMEAADARAVVERLQRDAYFPITIAPQGQQRRLLGVAWPELFQYAFRSSPPEAMQMLSQLGLILLMFQIGLEFDFSHLREKQNFNFIIPNIFSLSLRTRSFYFYKRPKALKRGVFTLD